MDGSATDLLVGSANDWAVIDPYDSLTNFQAGFLCQAPLINNADVMNHPLSSVVWSASTGKHETDRSSGIALHKNSLQICRLRPVGVVSA